MYAVRIWWSWKFIGTPKDQSWDHDRNVEIYWWISKLTNVLDPLNFSFPLKCLYFVTVYGWSALLILCRNIGQNSWEVAHSKKNFIFFRFVLEPFFRTFLMNFIFSKIQNVFKKKTAIHPLWMCVHPTCMPVCVWLCIWNCICLFVENSYFAMLPLFGWTLRMRRTPMCIVYSLIVRFILFLPTNIILFFSSCQMDGFSIYLR